jgi:hypothetical protein
MPNLTNFMASFREGFQRSNRFLCKLDLSAPSMPYPFDRSGASIQNTYPTAVALLKQGILCSSVGTPNRSFETTELDIYGYRETYPVGIEYGDLECTFLAPLVNGKNEVLQVFQAWHYFIQSHSLRNVGVQGKDDLVLRFPSEYRVPQGMSIETLTTDTNTGRVFTTNKMQIYNVYPKSINSTQLDWAEQDAFMTVSVTFLYTSWEMVPTS